MDFSQPRTVGYCDGPAVEGVAESARFSTRWAAWVGKTGVRVGQFNSVTPPAITLGNPSLLFPTTKPTALSISFDNNGRMSIAIEKTETLIQIRRFTDGIGTIDTREWSGQSPQLFNNWLLHFDLVEPTSYDMVCFYLKDSYSDKIYVRFAVDNYTAEYELNYDLPSDLDYLIGVDRYLGLQQVLYAKTKNGDNATLTSDIYGPRAKDYMAEFLEMVSGDYFNRAVILTSPENDAATLSIDLVRGEVLEVAKTDQTGLGTQAIYSITLDQGDYTSAT